MKKRVGSRKASNDIKPEDILEGHTLKVRAIAKSLRELIKKTVPAAIEAAYPTWHGIGYRHPESGYFCGIFPQEDSVKLGFEFGALLPDPHGLLEGAGKQVRYVIIKDKKDIRVGPIKKLLLAAVRLKDKKQLRIELDAIADAKKRGLV
jgi:hypothetical protein